MKAEELKRKINALEAELQCIQNGIREENTRVLLEEVLNLLDGVGDGFRMEDYYASTRYYSRIPGVKNIRIVECNPRQTQTFPPYLEVKVLSPKGELLPRQIEVRGQVYKVTLVESKRYDKTMDY